MSLATSHSGHINTPRNVQQITKQAQDYDYSALVPVRKWLRTAGNILRQAEVYAREGNDEETYFLLFRHAHLVLTNIAAHPEARLPANRAGVEEAEKTVKDNLKALEALRPRINKRYEKYQAILRDREARRVAAEAAGERRPSEPHYIHPEGHIQTLEPREHGDLAVRLAQKEARRREGRRPQSQYPGGEEVQRRRQGQYGSVYETTDDAKDDLSRSLQEVRARVDHPQGHYSAGSRPATGDKNSNYSYPSVPSGTALSRAWGDTSTSQAQEPYASSPPPSRPPKQPAYAETSRMQPPLIPSKVPPSIPSKSTLTAEPSPPRSDTPPQASYTFKTAATTESGTPLRTLFLPPDLRRNFLQIALPNTSRNLETCGILAGSLISNALFISHLVIPSQNSTTDTCEMEDESALFDFVDQQDLMVFGWIHTHPTQTCFMSSRDLHTQSGYQVMLPESIAIVCAPSQHTQQHSGNDHDGDWGCFRLTDPPGLKSILACTKSGLFHPHEVQNIYTGALRPGHVVEAKGLEFKLVDLRNK